MDNFQEKVAFIWSVADLLRGDYKQSEYGKVILPLTVIRRLDCVLEPTKQAVLEKHKQLAGKIENVEPVLQAIAGERSRPTTFTPACVRGLRASTSQAAPSWILTMRHTPASSAKSQPSIPTFASRPARVGPSS